RASFAERSCGYSRRRDLAGAPAVAFQQLERDRARPAVADDPIVDPRHGAQLARRARDEGLVGGLEILREQRAPTYLDADVAPDVEQNRPSQAFEQARLARRRERHAGADDEEVGLRALGQLAAVIAHQAFFRPALSGLLHRERV